MASAGGFVSQLGGRGALPRAMCLLSSSLFALALGACGGGSESSQGGGGGGGGASSVTVTLQEWAVLPDTDTTEAGEVTFNPTNKGSEVHEFVVVKTDLGNRDLPTNKDGSVDEEGAGIEPVDEVEDIPVGGSEQLKVDLDAGHYVMFCNIVEKEDGEAVSHYANGMSTDFTVE
jgi:hypothetical protein